MFVTLWAKNILACSLMSLEGCTSAICTAVLFSVSIHCLWHPYKLLVFKGKYLSNDVDKMQNGVVWFCATIL